MAFLGLYFFLQGTTRGEIPLKIQDTEENRERYRAAEVVSQNL